MTIYSPTCGWIEQIIELKLAAPPSIFDTIYLPSSTHLQRNTTKAAVFEIVQK